MAKFQIGDVIYLNSESKITLTVTSIAPNGDQGTITATYFSMNTHAFENVRLPEEACTKAY